MIDLEAIRVRYRAYTASHDHAGAFACCTAHGSADDVSALLAEIDRLNARLTAAHKALAIDEFDGDSCATLESTIEYAVHHYRLVCDSEAETADEIARLKAEATR